MSIPCDGDNTQKTFANRNGNSKANFNIFAVTEQDYF